MKFCREIEIMNACESHTYKELFREDIAVNLEKIIPLVQKCIRFSSNEVEVLRALQISFEFGNQVFSLDELETELFQIAGPAAKKLFFKNLENLEKSKEFENIQTDKERNFKPLENCTQIISYFCLLFTNLNNYPRVKLIQVESLLLNSAEILYGCFCHCNMSEEVYGSLFESVSNFLSFNFKKGCELLELLLMFLSNNLVVDHSNDTDITVLCEMLDWLSKYGLILMNLDVKVMANVWKTQVGLIEKYICQIKEYFAIELVINSLTQSIIFNIDNALKSPDDQDFSRKIKLACFNLKLIIKFCEMFNGYIKKCQKLLLKLLLTLCGCGFLEVDDVKFLSNTNKELLKQLSFGAEPLLSQLISYKELVTEFSVARHNFNSQKNEMDSFLVICCWVLKKLMQQNNLTRDIWLSKNNNILIWLFDAVASDQYNVCLQKKLPEVVIGGKLKKVYDMYQYLLIGISSFIMTSSLKEFSLIEKILIKYVLQQKPLCALLAIDIWCLYARFATSELCLTQILRLYSILNEFKHDTFRVEKYYLMTLIERLYPLLTQNHKKLFNESFNTMTSHKLWNSFSLNYHNNDLNLLLINDFNSSYWFNVEKFIGKSDAANVNFELNLEDTSDEETSAIFQNHEKTLENPIMHLWTFDVTYLFNHQYKENFFRILCLLTAEAVSCISSENIILILSKMRKLLIDESLSFSLFFIPILNNLSSISFSNNFQQQIVKIIAEIFGILLRWKKIFIKGKALESFYHFSHTTKYPETITLSVNQFPGLKSEITNYFKKISSFETNFNLNEFMIKLCSKDYLHTCFANDRYGNNYDVQEYNIYDKCESCVSLNYDEEEPVSNEIHLNVQDILDIWKKKAETLMSERQRLSDTQKKEIINVCNYLLSSVR